MEGLRGLSSPPFANYDLVVYFGGGLFFIPFAYRYLLEPLGLRLPQFSVAMGSAFLTEAVATLATLFIIYVIGHMLAYSSSQLIEKALDRVFGKVSSAIVVSCRSNPSNRNELIRSLIFSRLRKIGKEKAIIVSIFRFLFHAPAIPIYLGIFALGFFGYYDTRIPRKTLNIASHKLKNMSQTREYISIHTKWYKPLEHYVINRCVGAVPRMYNYLIISGLFRTLSLVFMLSMWALIYFMFHFIVHGHWLVKPLFGAGPEASAPISFAVEFSFLTIAFAFSTFSFLKFQRRYAEEAIFAFVFEPQQGSPAT